MDSVIWGAVWWADETLLFLARMKGKVEVQGRTKETSAAVPTLSDAQNSNSGIMLYLRQMEGRAQGTNS